MTTYSDVSNSMSGREYPGDFAFSMQVAAWNARGTVRGGGTDYQAVFDHARANGFRAIEVITDFDRPADVKTYGISTNWRKVRV